MSENASQLFQRGKIEKIFLAKGAMEVPLCKMWKVCC